MAREPVKNRKQRNRPQWQTPVLTEIPLTGNQRHYIAMLTKWSWPENEDWHLLTVPEDAILAALSKASRAALTTSTVAARPHAQHIWFKLVERDRHALRAVCFHDSLDAALSNRQLVWSKNGRPQHEVDWLRWLAVCEARREGKSWEEARKTASDRLKRTPANGRPGSMKRSYELVQCILGAGPSIGLPAPLNWANNVIEENAALKVQVAGLEARIEELASRAPTSDQ